MTILEYLSEDGSGTHARWHVPDLVPGSGTNLKMVFIFESPHVHELEARVPVVGAAGRDALRFLTESPDGASSLGKYVRDRINDADDRFAILNVSNVPMQAAAFVATEGPGPVVEDWSLIERVRRSTSRSLSAMRSSDARSVSQALAAGLRGRLENLEINPDCLVVTAGVFAQRMADALPEPVGEQLRVPHPSFNQWNRGTNQGLPDLLRMQSAFQQIVAE